MRVCILGATGLVGKETLDLVQRAWPQAELALYASRDQTLQHGGRAYEVSGAEALEGADARGGDVAFVALDDDHSKRFVPRLLDLGYRVIDKSNTYRLDTKVPLVVAGVNSNLVNDGTRLVANPNCTTIPLMLALRPLRDRFGLVSLAVSTYQAISGAGQATLDEFLAESRRGYAEADRLGLAFDPLKYAGNTVPHSGKTDDSGLSAEERKLVQESRKILALADLPISAQACRVPVAVGHYENVWVTLSQVATMTTVSAALEAAGPFVRWFPALDGEGLSALACVHDRDRALVGRLRRDLRDDNGRSFCLTVVADNLRLGAATNAVRIASRWFPSKDAALQA